MSRWFRHYAGMMRDEKLVSAAMRSGQPVERVIWVWGAILESAAEINDGGRYDFDAAEAAYFLRSSDVDIVAIITALESLGRLCSGIVAKWGDRQYQSDSSTERQRAYRDRQKVNRDAVIPKDDAVVTTGDGEVTAQETEADTKAEEDRGLTPSCGTDDTTEIKNLWNEVAERTGIPSIALLNDTRKKALKLRLTELGGIDGWRAMLEIIGKSPHLLGENDRGWKITFDWILKPANLTKVMEGNYVRAKANRPKSIPARYDAIRAAIEGGSDQGNPDSGEDPFGLSGLRQSA